MVLTAPQLSPALPPTAAERVGLLLRRERNALKLSQQTLADRLGIHQATLARWELGRSTPSLAQVDEVLGYLGVRLRLDVEPTPDPRYRWDRETLRLAAMTPAERLEEVDSHLAGLMQRVAQFGVRGSIDGQTAAWLQGVPGPPLWMEIAATPEHVYSWLTLDWVAKGVVDAGRNDLFMSKTDATQEFIREGHGHFKSIFGYITLRVVTVMPVSVTMCLREAGDAGERVDAEVIRLEALARHWQQQTP